MGMRQTYRFSDDQRLAVREAHARPSTPISSPAEVGHLAFRAKPEVVDKAIEALAPGGSSETPRHAAAARGGVAYAFERHTEFSSLTWIDVRPAQDGAMAAGPADILDPGTVEALVLLEIRILDDAAAFDRAEAGAGRVLSGVFAHCLPTKTTLSPRDDGAVVFYVLAKSIEWDELGRRIQRLIEMETYRTMCLLGLPLARRAADRIGALEEDLERITAAMRAADLASVADDEAIFAELSTLSAEIGALSAETRFRFAASRAYYDLVRQRLDALDETQIDGVQSITGFVLTRLNPAIATVESTGRRLETLAADVLRAVTLLRTRIELNLNRGNQSLLKSMDERHRQQVQISEAVESLSTVAITYYAVGLLAYAIGATLALFPGALSEKLAIALSIPVVFGCVWAVLRRARSRWRRERRLRG